MYEIVKNVIESGQYELTDMLKKIDTIWLQGTLDDDQRTELIELARSRADPEQSYDIQKQLESIFSNLSEMGQAILELTDRVTKLEGGSVTPPVVDEYPQFVQPTGAHDAYNTGDKVTYNGKKYICQMDNCVWTPDAYTAVWKLVE